MRAFGDSLGRCSNTPRQYRTRGSANSTALLTLDLLGDHLLHDIGLASEPGAHYVLVSTREHGNNEGPVEFRSYRIVDGEVTEEEVTVVPTLA